MAISATATINGVEVTDIPVVNPGNWFGRTWLCEIGGSMEPIYLFIEADSFCSAIDELADSDTHRHHIVVEHDDLDDYAPEECSFGPSGQILDLDWLLLHGDESKEVPFPCRYFGDGLPEGGIDPTELHEWEWESDETPTEELSQLL